MVRLVWNGVRVSFASSIIHGGLPVPNPVLWMDASLASTLTIVSGKVSAWASRVGGITLSQSNALNRPAYSATGWNSSKPAVHFTGATASTALGTPFSFWSGVTNPPQSFAARLNISTRGVQQRLFALDNVAGSSTATSIDASSANKEQLDKTSGGSPVTGSTVITGANLTWTGAWVSTLTTFLNGVKSINAASFASTETQDTLTMGWNGLIGNLALEAQVTEFLLFDYALTDAQQVAVQAYLNAKWG